MTTVEDSASRLRRLRSELGPDHPETKAAFDQRVAEVAAVDYAPGLYFLSFCDPNIPIANPVPGGPSWLGACVVEAQGPTDAVRVAWSLGCNPGGAAKIIGPLPQGAVGPEWMNRLLTQAEVDAIPAPGEAPLSGRCICTPHPYGDGPERECPVHGEP